MFSTRVSRWCPARRTLACVPNTMAVCTVSFKMIGLITAASAASPHTWRTMMPSFFISYCFAPHWVSARGFIPMEVTIRANSERPRR